MQFQEGEKIRDAVFVGVEAKNFLGILPHFCPVNGLNHRKWFRHSPLVTT